VSELGNEIARCLAAVRARLPADAEGRPLCDCGAVLAPEELELYCGACQPKRQEARRERQRQERIASFRRYVVSRARRGFGPVPAWAHVQHDSPDFARIIRSPELQRFAERYDPRRGSAALLGPTGFGKTSAVARALHRYREESIRRVYAERSESALDFIAGLKWTTGYELVRARREWPLGQGEAPEVAGAVAATMLVIDDLGNEPPDPVIFELLDLRYRAEKPVIITSGLRAPALRERIGDAAWRRVAELGAVVDGWQQVRAVAGGSRG
jgi:DNA replication protein DnaC